MKKIEVITLTAAAALAAWGGLTYLEESTKNPCSGNNSTINLVDENGQKITAKLIECPGLTIGE